MSSLSQTLFGVDLSGLEFGSGTLPGAANVDYAVPTHTEIDYYAAQGMNVIRLPFLWERMQPTLNGSLDSTYLGYVQDLVNYAATKGVTVVLDCHDFGFYTANGVQTRIGTGPVTDAAFANFWQQMATAFINDQNVIFDIMNEPEFSDTSSDAQAWLAATDAAVAAIRGAGATQEILIPTPNWDHASNFMGSQYQLLLNSVAGTSQSPFSYGNVALEFHQYFDSDGSGTHFTPITDPNIGSEDLSAATAWARANGVRLILGETAFPTDSQSQVAEANLINYLQQNSDVWQGATLWGAGPWWGPWNGGGYGFSLDPGNNNATSPSIATFDSSTEPSLLYTYYFGSNTSYTSAASTNNAYDGDGDTIAVLAGGQTVVSGNGNTINASSNDILSVGGSADTVNLSGASNVVNIGGNGQYATNANLDEVNACAGGTVNIIANSRVDVHGSGMTINAAASVTVGAFGSADIVNITNSYENVWIGGNGQFATVANVDYIYNAPDVSGGTYYVIDNSRVTVYGSNTNISLGSSDVLGAYGSALSITIGNANDQVWVGGNGQFTTFANVDVVSDGAGATGGSVYVSDNSRVTIYANGATITAGTNDLLGVYGSGLNVTFTGTNGQVYIGDDGQYASNANDDIVTFNNGGGLFENSNSRVDATGANVTATMGANDLLGMYGSNDTIIFGQADSLWTTGSWNDTLVFSGNVGAANLYNFGNNLINLLNGEGGYATAAAAYSALSSDGNGGSLLSLGANGSIDIIGIAPTSLSASNFKIG